jgi:protein-disulfide isomerase
MTHGGGDDSRLSNNERREAARQKAKVLRAQHKKKDRRTRVLIQGGLVVVVLALVIVVALVIVNTYLKAPAPGPLNMASDGIKIGQNLDAVTTGAVQPGKEPVPSASNAPNVIDIQVYIDYQAPPAATFQKTNTKQIETWVKRGAATVEIHPISLLDRYSQGAKYSTRSANAAACVANYSSNSFYDFNARLFAHQPKEGSNGLTDAQLVKLVTGLSDVKRADSITRCITDQKFKSWVNATTARATAGPIPNSKVKKVTATPTVIVNGEPYAGDIKSANDFAQFVNVAAGNAFTEESTASPSPSPSSSTK